MVVLALCLSLASALADESGIAQTPSPLVRIGAESGGAIVCGYGAGIIGALGTYAVFQRSGADFEENIGAAVGGVLLGYAVALPAGCALGAWGIGSLMQENRPFWPALLGGYCGAVIGGGTYYLMQQSGWPAPVFYAYDALALLAPPAGAVIGYNLGRPRDSEYGWLEQHLDMPRMAMTVSRDELNRPVAGVKCDLLAARF